MRSRARHKMSMHLRFAASIRVTLWTQVIICLCVSRHVKSITLLLLVCSLVGSVWLAESCCLAVELVWLSRLSMCPLLFWYLHIAVVRALHRWYVYALYCVCSRACVCVFTVPKIDALLTLPHFSLHTNVCDMFLFASSSSSSVIFGWFSVGSLKTYHMFFIRFKKFDTPNAYVWMLLDGNGSNLAIWWFNRYVLGAVGETNCSVTLTAFDAFSSNKRMCLMCTIPFDELHLHANGICMFQQKLLPKWKGK